MQKLRPYQASDWDQVCAIFNLNVPQYFAAHEIEGLKEYLQQPHYASTFVVLEQAGQIVGAGGYHFLDAHTGQLTWDFLHPDFQGQGLGRQLIQYCLDELQRNKSLQIIQVRTSQFAYPFYEKFGFATQEIVPDYWAEGFDLYRMQIKFG